MEIGIPAWSCKDKIRMNCTLRLIIVYVRKASRFMMIITTGSCTFQKCRNILCNHRNCAIFGRTEGTVIGLSPET